MTQNAEQHDALTIHAATCHPKSNRVRIMVAVRLRCSATGRHQSSCSYMSSRKQ